MYSQHHLCQTSGMKHCGKVILVVALYLAGSATRAWSSTFRPMPLSKLIERSTLVVVATPVSFNSHWTTMGSTSHVVTDVTLEVDWTLRGNDFTGKDIAVRTLGGTVGGVAHMAYGEAPLRVGQTFLLSLVSSRDDARAVAARKALGARVDAAGEPFKSTFTPNGLSEDLGTLGFSQVDALDSAVLNARYFAGRGDGLSLRGGNIMRARV